MGEEPKNITISSECLLNRANALLKTINRLILTTCNQKIATVSQKINANTVLYINILIIVSYTHAYAKNILLIDGLGATLLIDMTLQTAVLI